MVSLSEILAIPEYGESSNFKCRIARLLRPRMILDLGVGDGEAGYLFLTSCPTAHYVGLQRWQHRDVAALLRGIYPDAWIEVHPREDDDRRVRRHFGVAFDLVHIDGEESEEHCLSDLRLAKAMLRSGGHILLEGFQEHGEARQATARFLREAGPGYKTLNLPSRGGDILLCKPRIA